MKRIIAILLAVVMVFALAACNGDNGASSTANVNLTDVINKINSDYQNNMTAIADASQLSTYYEIKSEDVKSFAAEIDRSGIDEVVLVEATDSDAVSRVQQCLNNRYQSKVQQGASYSPEELNIIKSCSVKTNGNYVSLIVSKDAQGMETIYNSYF